MLVQASDLVTKLELPLQTPLQSTNVSVFSAHPYSGPEDSTHLGCYLVYEGGYEFWHDHGRIGSFCTPDSFDPSKGARMSGEICFSEAECLAKAKEAIRSLGYTNVSMLDSAPSVQAPFVFRGKTLPRYVFEWTRPGEEVGEPPWRVAKVEVNANRLRIESLNLYDSSFWGEAWPVTFGQTNVIVQKSPPKPKRSELELKGVTQQYALAYIRAALPQISAFCSKLGMCLPNPILETDIVMGESKVAMVKGRPMASLGLKTGHEVAFYKGHVTGIQTHDTYFKSPWREENVRKTPEYFGPIKFSKDEVAEKVRKLLLGQLGLPAESLFLNTDPVFQLTVNLAATKGVRRYYFGRQRPEINEERNERESMRLPPELSVTAEVDAVSGEIEALLFWHESLNGPDPKLDILPEANGASAPLTETNSLRQGQQTF